MEYYRLKYMTYGIRAHNREDAIQRGQKLIAEDPKAFVVDAERFTPKRSTLGRLIFGG